MGKIIIVAIIVLAILVIVLTGIFGLLQREEDYDDQIELSAEKIMEIIKTDKDYSELSKFIEGFDPKIVAYIKLGPNEYGKIKPEWQEAGFEERTKIIDGLKLTEYTYWVELKNKHHETKGLRTILDTKENKSLLLMASMSVSAGIGGI